MSVINKLFIIFIYSVHGHNKTKLNEIEVKCISIRGKQLRPKKFIITPHKNHSLHLLYLLSPHLNTYTNCLSTEVWLNEALLRGGMA